MRFTLQSNIDFEDLGFKTMTPNKKKQKLKQVGISITAIGLEQTRL